MPSAIAYPATLPGPEGWAGSFRERRAVSGLPGNTALRVRYRDTLQDVEARWMYTEAEMSLWQPWYETTLRNGLLWFAASIPGAAGFTQQVVKYRTGSLRKEYIGNGVYKVSAQMQQRGFSAAPVALLCFLERFNAGLTPYSTVSGSGSLFTTVTGPYGQALRYTGTTSGTVSAIDRTISAVSAQSIKVKFLVETASVDDAAAVVVQTSSLGLICAVLPRRESTFDAAQRVQIVLGGDTPFVGSAAAVLNVWYEASISVVPGAGNSTYSVTRLDTGALLGAGAFASNHTLLVAERLKFNDDPILGSSATRYADIEICEG